MTEQKIREAFEKWKEHYALVYEPNYSKATEADCCAAYKAGYMALLNEIEQFGYMCCYQGQDVCFSTKPQDPAIPSAYYWQEKLYRLPEGVEKP